MSAILDWRGHVDSCAEVCHEQFHFILCEYGYSDIDSQEFCQRICSRYAGHLKTIHHKVKRYFNSLFGLHGVAEQFSKKDAKWLLPMLAKRTNNPEADKSTEAMEALLLWVSLRYDFWLGQQLYK